MKTKAQFLFTGLVVLMLLAGITAVAFAGEIHVKHASLDDHQNSCLALGGTVSLWHFVITQMTDTTAPASIHVIWNNAAELDVPLGKVSGGVAHYTTIDNPGSLVMDAIAVVPDSWETEGGQFNLSHVTCESAPQPQDLTVAKTAAPSYTRTFEWGIAQSVDYDRINTAGSATFNYTVKVTREAIDSDWQVAGNITVHNPNEFDVAGVTVTDAIPGGNCTVVGSPLNVPAGGDAVAAYVCTFDSNPGSGTNTAIATWPDIGSPNTSASGSANFDFGAAAPAIVNGSVDVSDDLYGPLGSVSYTDSNPTEFQYPLSFEGVGGTCTDYTNTASLSTGASASKTVMVCVGLDPSVTKTATPTFTRTYAWEIGKAVDKTLVKQVGGAAIFNYTVNARQTGFSDSDWAVTGKIVVTNPNDWEAVTTDLTDAVNIGGTCTLDASQVTVPASASVEVGYACALTSGASGAATATATWDSAAYSTPVGSASGTADLAFTTPTATVNKTITVTDTFNGVVTTLGTLTAMDEQPFASATFSYANTVTVPAWNCVSYTNIAKIVETDQSASQTVMVCGPAKTGALTMGFWQNKNGQGIINNGAAVSGICKSGTWLRQYAPFQDLSATASCPQVAAYTFNVIKAASAAGAAMNPMLKAQMLASSLDVYFSNAALGGNAIKAPAPIGGVSIDLTLICADMSCAAFENSRSVFGGTPKTALEMLAYAASQSNVGGSLWYGNVKSTQELAKDAFDAINNEKVFAP